MLATHFELSSSMLTFGVIAGWVWTLPARHARSEAEQSARA